MKKIQQNFSREHLLYLNGLKKNKILVWCVRLGLLLFLIAIWEILASFKIIDPFITSSPSRILKTCVELYNGGNLFYHIGITLGETIIGFIISVVLGCLIALALWWSETLRKILEPYIVVLNSLPKIALGPLIIIWFGTGSKSIIFMTVLVSVIICIMNMLGGFLETDKNKILLVKSMGATKFQILTKVVIPSSIPTFIGMLKICVGMAWIGSIMGEYISSRAGLGYLIVFGGQVFKLDLVMSATAILCALAGIMYALVCLLEKKVVKRP